MSSAIAALAAIKAIQLPLGLLATLHLTGEIWPPEPLLKNNSCYDYIIVGGGTAGMVVARRLTENKSINVMVLEAGGNPPIEALLPALFVTEPETELDWDYRSTYDSYAAHSQPGNVTKLTSGKMLGGSSCINHFIHIRGAPHDFNQWASIVYDDSWRYKNVLPYFKKSERLEDPVIGNSSYRKYHGFEGPMGVARQPRLSANPYLVSFGERGNRVMLDNNGPNTLGYVQSTFIVTDGLRQCASYSYIRPVKDRENLFVFRHTYATKILFDDKKRAIAVEAYIDEKKYIFKASREIIVCAGVFKSPQLLMLSGIGPEEHLKSLDIKVIANLPVGDNWQEHLAVSIVHRTDQSVVDPVIPLPTLIPFPVIVGTVTLNKHQTYGDYQVYALVIGKETPNLILTCAVIFGYNPDICDKFNIKIKGYNSLYSLLALLKPCSRGKVRLNSTNPFDDPVIDTNFYGKERDLQRMVAYVKDYIKVSNTTFFTQINAKLIDPELEECKDLKYGSDDYWRCYILHTTVSTYHSTSTCSMGSVVDSRLRVRKVKRLRVVDASVMPRITAGNPHAAVIMIAEKASDMIKQDANKYLSCKELKECGYDIQLPDIKEKEKQKKDENKKEVVEDKNKDNTKEDIEDKNKENKGFNKENKEERKGKKDENKKEVVEDKNKDNTKEDIEDKNKENKGFNKENKEERKGILSLA